MIVGVFFAAAPRAMAGVCTGVTGGAVGISTSALVMNCPRSAHTVTTLPNGNLLIVGGVDKAGTIIGAYELDLEQKGVYQLWGGLPGDWGGLATQRLQVARASHTATLLPNGKVLVVGGKITGGAVTGSAELYDPVANTWACTAACGADITARYNHTATLLKNGKVLICGGQSDATTSLDDCRFYDPAGNSFSAAPALLSKRTLHSATLISDGRVLFAGGFDNSLNPAYPTTPLPSPFLANTEMYDPVNNSFAGAHGLIQGRAYHTATAMGDGTVLFVGGYNGNKELASLGVLQSAETYDPISDSVAPAAPLCFSNDPDACMRVQSHTGTLQPDGSVEMFGGLGNVTTGFFIPANVTFGSNSILRGKMCAPPVRLTAPLGSTTTIKGDASVDGCGSANSSLSIPLDFHLASKAGTVFPVSGTIKSGTVYLSTPSSNFQGGYAYFGTTNPLTGPQVDLAGVKVNCDAGGCGHISTTFALKGVAGYMGINPVSASAVDFAASAAANGCVAFTNPNPLTSLTGPANIDDAGTGCGGLHQNKIGGATTLKGLPATMIGAIISSGTHILNSGSILIQTTTPDPGITGGIVFTITLVSGHLTLTAPTSAIYADPLTGLGDVDLPSAIWSNLSGQVVTTSTNPVNSPLIAGAGVTITETGCGGGNCTTPNLTLSASGLDGTLSFAPSLVDVSNAPLTIDIATVVIRGMVFANTNTYDPQNNQWAYANLTGVCPAGSLCEMGDRYGASSTLLPNHIIRHLGGLECDFFSGTCSTMVPAGSDSLEFPSNTNYSTILTLPDWTGGPLARGRRANHTATPLPDGRLLIAGGSNGPNSLQTAEIYDPVSDAFTPTGSMAGPHTLHTASLLPNGRVLVAGGFTTNASSSGSTTTAEIYYSNPGIWIPTSPMQAPRDQHTATLLPDGNVLVAGGFNKISGYLQSAEIYVSTTGSWQSLGNVMPRPLARHSATLLQTGEVLFVGGINSGGIRGEASIYNPTSVAKHCAAGAWCDVTSLSGSAVTYLHSATLLPGGSVLVAGGDNGLGEIPLSQVYDPPTGNWTVTRAQMGTGRANHTATLLPDGSVLVSGGATHNAGTLRTVETFDIGAGTWTSHGFMQSPRAYHTTTMLADGTLYDIGGINGQTYLDTSEKLYFGFNDRGSIGAPPSIRVSSISAIDAISAVTRQGNFNYGSTVTFTGSNFMGFTEANGGSGGTGQSGFYHPRLNLQAMDGSGGSSSQGNSGFILDLSTRIYNETVPDTSWSKITGFGLTASSLTVIMPSSATTGSGSLLMPTGWYQARMGNNALFSGGSFVQVGPPRISSSIAPLTAAIDCSTAVTFNWAPAAGADGYNVYSTTAAVWITSLPANRLFYTQGNLTSNTTMSLTIAPFSIMGDGPTLVAAEALTLATVAVNVTISSVSSSSILLTWGANGNGGSTTYEVSYASVALILSTGPGGPARPAPPFWSNNEISTFPYGNSVTTPTLVQTLTYTPPLTATSFQIDSLASNTTYFFRVRAFNSNVVPSNFSNIASTTTRSVVGQDGIKANHCDSGRETTCIKWTWDAVSNVAPISYKIRTSTMGFLATNIVASPPFFEDTGLLPNSTRQVLVSAVTAPGEGDLISSPTGYTLAAAPINNATNYSVVNISTGHITPQWSRGVNPTLITTYRVVFSSQVDLPFTSLPVTDKGIDPMLLSFSDLVPAEIYSAKISGLNQIGEESATTLDLPKFSPLPDRPSTITVTGITATSIGIQWDTFRNASTATYAVFYSSSYFLSASSPLISCENFTDTYFTTLLNPYFSTAVFYTDANQFTDVERSTIQKTITGLQTNQLYTFAVCSRNAFGQVFKRGNKGSHDNNSDKPPWIVQITTAGGAIPGSFAVEIADPNIDNDLAGTVSTVNPRALTLHVPAGAFPSPVTVTFSSYSNTTPLCPGTTNAAISIITDPPFQPLKPLTLSLAFTTEELAGFDSSQVTLMRYDPATGKCLPFITSVDRTTGFINAQINHFTIFLIGAVTPSNTVDTARAFPNPFFPATDGFMTFENVPPYARIRIYTQQGETVYDRQANGSGLLTWPGINKAGRFVASGTYFVSIEAVGSSQRRKLMKVVILR